MSSGIYGLPGFVVALLRQMETHKDCLKWTLTEGSHKIALTLTWDLSHNDLSTWRRFQRSLKFAQPNDRPRSRSPECRSAGSSPKRPENFPKALTTFLDSCTTKKRSLGGGFRRELSSTSPFQRNNPDWSRASTRSLSSSVNTMPRSRSHSGSSGLNHVTPPRCRRNSAHGGSTGTQPPAWTPSCDAAQPRTSTPNPPDAGSNTVLCTPPRGAHISYHEEDDLRLKSEERVARRRNEEELKRREEEWREVVSKWEEFVVEKAEPMEGGVGTKEEERNKWQPLNDTVHKCLETCDNILLRHSTPIT